MKAIGVGNEMKRKYFSVTFALCDSWVFFFYLIKVLLGNSPLLLSMVMAVFGRFCSLYAHNTCLI